ncbi:MAG: glycyl radical protein [Oscillospiraceae bacterium]|jgi:formate C-acetyltransferase|nr:glycyl radical protein [Oscillospiraceae bacterium]
MTERVRILRQESLDAEPRICMERALLETEAYKMYEGKVSVPELRALVFKHIMENKTLWIGKGELLVGEKASAPQAAPSFPEICCHTLNDLRVMNERELIFFRVAPDDFKAQEEVIIPFWKDRALRDRLLAAMTAQWRDCYDAGIFTEFMEQRGPGHTVGSRNIYDKGFLEYKEDIQNAITALDRSGDTEALQKHEQLTAMSICCDGIMALGRRFAAYARELAKIEVNDKRRDELLQIAENCDVVPAHKPKTYWQALQMYWFVHIGVTTEINPWDAYSPGRLDQHLFPFFLSDCDAGILDKESALELLECLWVKFNNQPAPPKVGVTLKESGTYTDFANINTGGIAEDGTDGVNDVSYLILDCMDEMRLLQPSSNVQISRSTPREFLLRACEISRKGWGQPAFYNTEAIVQELLNAGKSLADARQGGSSGCVETGAFGNEAYILTGYFNLPKILEITLNNGFDPVSGVQLGPKTGCAESFAGYQELFDAYVKQIKHFVDIKVAGSNVIESFYARYLPVPFLSIVTNDCIANGKDYNAGGARYNTSYIQGVGIGSVTDSLSAVRFAVFDEKLFSMERLLVALVDNFDGFDDVLSAVKYKSPKYGNDDDRADKIMQAVFGAYHKAVTGRPNTRGGEFRVNMLPTTCHIYFGEVTGALPNGRCAGLPLSEGISPSQGADINGPTAALLSASKMDQLITGGTLLNQKFTPGVVAGEKGLDGMASLVAAYFELNGHHIQFNVVDRQTLLDAQERPDEYRNLIVRVAGYSDHFRNLSRALQDEIIERTEQCI